MADKPVLFRLTGPGVILGVGNGDPASRDPEKATQVKTFTGLAQAIIQSTQVTGTLELMAQSPGLKEAHMVVHSKLSRYRRLFRRRRND